MEAVVMAGLFNLVMLLLLLMDVGTGAAEMVWCGDRGDRPP